MSASWVRTVAPVLEPITLLEAKQHARIVQTDENQVLQRFIRAATEAAEEYLGRGLLTQTWQLTLDALYDEIYLPMAAPLQNDSGDDTEPIVQYYDTNGTLQTLANTGYVVHATTRPASLIRTPWSTWPTVQGDRRAGRVVITYVVGWTAPALIPERIKQGIRLYVTAMDADRAGFEEASKNARIAAEACWSDRVIWIPPVCDAVTSWPA